jgi:hypothetical protein
LLEKFKVRGSKFKVRSAPRKKFSGFSGKRGSAVGAGTGLHIIFPVLRAVIAG